MPDAKTPQEQPQRSQQPRGTATSQPAEPPAPTPGEAVAPAADEHLAAVTRTATELAAAGAAGVAPVGPAAVGEAPADSDVTDELTGGGVAFGEFVKSVGLAVASAQEELDKTMRETAKELSETKIDVIAVFEQVTNDDDGSMAEGIVHNQQLPLINYIMPTAYAWSRVYLEADMNVQEFNSRSGFNIQQKSFSVGASTSIGFGGLGVSGSGQAGFQFGSSSTGVDQSAGFDNAAGKLHMEATLEPRADVQLPKPFILQKGPKLDVQVGAKRELKGDANDPTKVTGYEVSLTAILRKTDGSPNGTKPLSLTISDPSLSWTSDGKTDANGEMPIKVTRRVLDPATDKPVQALVRVSFGLVSQPASIAL
jgi:hypothetical protein